MSETTTVALPSIPSPNSLYLRAALGAVPLPLLSARSSTIPERAVEVHGVHVELEQLAAYCQATGLRLRDGLPLTYLFVRTFPLAMKLMTARDFPFSVVGAVHAENVIERTRDIAVDEPLAIRVHVTNLREHRRGLLADAVSEVTSVVGGGSELVWRQVATFLHKQRTSLSDQPGREPPPEQVPPPPIRMLHADQATAHRYAAVSGDRNPIHMSSVGAKLFGFPRSIAHGMWSAAAVLGLVEGRINPAARYVVKFGKPMLLPANVNAYADRVDAGSWPGSWELALRHPTKGYPYLTATLC